MNEMIFWPYCKYCESYRPPTQSPINPPYKEAVDMRRQDQLAKPTANEVPKIDALNLSDSS